MKEKLNKLGFHGIFTVIIIMGTMLLPVGTEYFLMVCTLSWMALRSIAVIRGKRSIRKKYHKTDLMIFIFLVYEILHMICQMIWVDEEKGIDLTWNLLFMALCMLYILCVETKEFYGVYLDGIVYSGLLIMGILLYCYTCDISAAFLLGDLMADTVGQASYLLLIGMVSVLQYCRCRNKMQNWFYGASAGISFFLLLINHNRVSLWLLAFFFMLVPICIRPTAELIKRDMQMFVLYALMLCNMSLLSNYTDLLLVEVSYDLEQSVYLELILALGAMIFFHYWDRIPEGFPLDRVVHRRLYRQYKYAAWIIFCLFVFSLLGGDGWKMLTESKGMTFLSNLARPLCEEIALNKSFLYSCTEEQGLLTLVGLFLILVNVIAEMRKNIGWDKPLTTGLYLVAIFGIVQCFIWNPRVNVLPVYLILAVGAMNYKEEKSRFVGIKVKNLKMLDNQSKQKNEEKEMTENKKEG